MTCSFERGIASSLVLAALAASAGACRDAAPARTAPSEVPFRLAPPSDEPDAAVDPRPTEIPPPDAEGEAAEAPPTPVPVAIPEEAGVPSCPNERGPSDLTVKPEPVRRGADRGAPGHSVEIVLDNRRSIPRTVEVTQIDRLDGVPGSPLKVSRITAREGGGGFPQSKMLLAAQATMHLVVEFEPAAPPPYRVRFRVDDQAGCIDSPSQPRSR